MFSVYQEKKDLERPISEEILFLHRSVIQGAKRLHYRLLEAIEDGFARSGRYGDIKASQALLLYEIPFAGVEVLELKKYSYHLGPGIPYHLKKLAKLGYAAQESVSHRRGGKVQLTEKGKRVSQLVGDLYDQHLKTVMQVSGVLAADLSKTNLTLSRLDRFLADRILYRL